MKKKYRQFSVIFVVLFFMDCNGAYNSQPELPKNLKATGRDGTAESFSISLSWEEAKKADSYYVYRAENKDPEQTEEYYIGNSTTLSYLDNKVKNLESNYHYAVSALNLYGKKESAFSNIAVGFLKRPIWELKGSFYRSVEFIKVKEGSGNKIWYCVKLRDGNLKAGFIETKIIEEENEEGEIKRVLQNFRHDFESSLGLAQSNGRGAGFDIAVLEDTLYLVWCDKGDSGYLKAKALTVEVEEETEAILWREKTLGSVISEAELEADPTVSVSPNIQEGGVLLSVGFITADSSGGVASVDDLHLSRFVVESSLIWESQDISFVETDFEKGIIGSSNLSKEQLFFELKIINFRQSLVISCLSRPTVAFYQSNFLGSSWNRVSGFIQPLGTILQKTLLTQKGENIFLAIEIDSKIGFYVFDQNWKGVTNGFLSSEVPLDWDWQREFFVYRDDSNFIKTKKIQYNEENWSEAGWKDFGRYSKDMQVEGVVFLAEAENLICASNVVRQFVFWTINNDVNWAILE